MDPLNELNQLLKESKERDKRMAWILFLAGVLVIMLFIAKYRGWI